ncbi:MAG: hypothetical protein ABIK09_07315 [Pseudomonadota bacterium]
MRTPPGTLFTCLAALLGVLLTTGVGADPLDSYGLTSRVRSMGGAATATSSSLAAVLYNPAAMTAGDGPVLGLGVITAINRLTPTGANGIRTPTVAYELALASPIPLGPGSWRRRVHMGLALILPHDHIYDFDMPSVDAPSWVGVGSSSRRLVLGASVAVKIIDRLSLGAGITLLPIVTGGVDLDLTDPEGQDTVRVDVNPRFRPIAGVLYEPAPGWRMGLSFRMGNHANIDLPVEVQASGIDLSARVAGPADWTPSVLSLGAELPVWKDRLTLTVQADWRFTRGYRHLSSDVALYDADGTDGLGAHVPAPRFRDSAAARLGMEWHLGRFQVRGGYAFVSRAAPEQTGRSNLLDAHRHHAAIGASADVVTGGGGIPRITLAVDGQLLALHGAVTEKKVYDPGNAGFPTLESGGRIWVVGGGVELGW